MLNDELLAVYVGLLVGVVIVTVGGVGSAGFIAAQPAMVLPPAFKKVVPLELRAGILE